MTTMKLTKNQAEWVAWALEAMSGLDATDAVELWGCAPHEAETLIDVARMARIQVEGEGIAAIVSHTFTEGMAEDLAYRLTDQAPDVATGSETAFDAHREARSAVTAWQRIERARDGHRGNS